MKRRSFLAIGAAAGLARGQKKPREEAVTAGATRDATPRVGLITSNYHGSEDHDGTKIPGLAEPKPLDADLTAAQIEAMLFKALDLGSPIHGGIPSIINSDDWVVIKPNIASCYGLESNHIPGAVTDLRIVNSLLKYLVDHKCGARITIAEGSAKDCWTTTWGGAFGGLSYKQIVDDFSRRYPDIRFEIVDLNFDQTVDLPVPGKPERTYAIVETIQQCDRLISVAPLKTDRLTGVSLSIKNYSVIAPGAKNAGGSNNVMLDLFSYHPADYAVVGGCWGIEGDGTSVHHNVIIAGTNALSVDAVATSVMGFTPADLPYFALAEKRGFGVADPDVIWIRGAEIDEARRVFRKPVVSG